MKITLIEPTDSGFIYITVEHPQHGRWMFYCMDTEHGDDPDYWGLASRGPINDVDFFDACQLCADYFKANPGLVVAGVEELQDRDFD